jgi:hypothetical protein
MRRVVLLMVVMAVVTTWLAGCKLFELTPEEKAKLVAVNEEIEALNKEIKATEATIPANSTGLIPDTIRARVEVDKLTLAILRQYAKAIETRTTNSTVSIQIYAPDLAILETLEREIEKANDDLKKARYESSLYTGGLIKNLIDARVSNTQLTIASLKRKYLQAKYGLNIPTAPLSSTQNEKSAEQSATEEFKQETIEINDPGPFDFRKVRWGMNVEEVQKREKLKVKMSDGKTLMYDDEVLGHKVSLIYLFVGNKLWRAGYLLDSDQYSNKNKYVDAYFEIVKILKQKYGTPTNDGTIWSKDLYKEDHENRGVAYSLGHVRSFTIWKKEQDLIEVSVSGNKYDVVCKITYSNVALQKEVQEKQTKEQFSKI